MSSRINVEIKPLQYYNKYASSDYTLCRIDFFLNQNAEEFHFQSESSNKSIDGLLINIKDFLSGNLLVGTELCYSIPWIYGEDCFYPYSFYVKDSETLTFRYKRNENDKQFDFKCDLTKDEVISMQTQINIQLSKTDWNALGITELYTFDFPEKAFEWCYSAKAFCKFLNELCVGSVIKKIYVGATNYAEPLRVDQNYVNYYIGSELLIQFDSFLLDLLIHAEGLFQWRVFNNGEHTIPEPVLKYIEDGYKEFCDIGNVYDNFNLDYTNSIIKQVTVDDTDCWPWDAKDFDESKVGNPIELPEAIHLHLDNGCVLSLRGLMDDFAIKMSQI
ncbi:MAG: hypothetical protein E7646_09850 [Ruminococcaceae bacterium]|nr:hypothetical protein [Oscillospiraceae bacterium]